MTCTKSKGRRIASPHAPGEFSDGAQYIATIRHLQQRAETAHTLRHLVRQARGRGLHLVTANQTPDTMSGIWGAAR